MVVERTVVCPIAARSDSIKAGVADSDGSRFATTFFTAQRTRMRLPRSSRAVGADMRIVAQELNNGADLGLEPVADLGRLGVFGGGAELGLLCEQRRLGFLR